MNEGLRGTPITLWYTSDFHLNDFNDKEYKEHELRRSQKFKGRKRMGRIVCKSSDEDDQDEPCSFPHVRDVAFGKRIEWTIDTVNMSTFLRDDGNHPGINT